MRGTQRLWLLPDQAVISRGAACASVVNRTPTRIIEDRSVLRRLGLIVSYLIAVVYIFSILLPSIYCFRHGCRGPGELDAFMPAFAFTPFGTIATAFSLHNSIQNIRKTPSSSWLFWPLAIMFSIVLVGVVVLVVLVIYHTAFHRHSMS